MSTAIETTTARGNNGVWTAARLNTVGFRQRAGMPWLIVAAIVVVTAAIVVLRGGNDGNDDNPAVLAAIMFSIAAGYLTAMTQTFPFALSLGVTRRNFYLGIGLVVLVESLMHAVGLTVLTLIERATDGWGLNIRFFGSLGFLTQDNPVAQIAAYAGPLLGLSSLALLIGAVFKRWGQPGVFGAGIVATLVFGGLAVLATVLGWWSAVGAFASATPALVFTAALPVVVALLAGGGGYLLIRRATP